MQWPFLVSGFSFPVESARHEAEKRETGTLFTHHMSGEAQDMVETQNYHQDQISAQGEQ
jgi:hypothetical protein